MARATISISSITSTTANVTVILNDAKTIHVVVREGPANGTGTIRYDSENISPTGTKWTKKVTWLTPNTLHTYNLWDDVGGWIGGEEFYTLPKPRPKYWSWTSGLVSSKPAINALSSGDDFPAYLSSAGWTAFVQNIRDVYSYANGTSYSGVLSDGGSGTTKLSADMVNQAITAIGTMTSSYIPSKTTSNVTKLSASLLNGLADSLNSIA